MIWIFMVVDLKVPYMPEEKNIFSNTIILLIIICQTNKNYNFKIIYLPMLE